MAFIDFRSTWPELLRELREGASAETIDRAEQILREINSENGMIEPDLATAPPLAPQRLTGQVVYDKFTHRRR